MPPIPGPVRTARRRALLEWYARHRRPLPWRTTRNSYRILVSEVMCQQTQADRVGLRYERFLNRFPDAEALAAASPAAVLEEWSGLGYNRRALHLHRAAQLVVRDGWPTTTAGLQRLPGVGPYTAAAVACFAFGQALPAVDTNLRRVLSRWHGTPLSGAELDGIAASELDRNRPAEWNQAVMDLGATLCASRTPACGQCPVTTWCADPSIYEPTRPQGRFAGSNREARGAVIRELVRHDPLTVSALSRRAGLAPSRVGRALDALVGEGLVIEVAGRFALPTRGAADGLE